MILVDVNLLVYSHSKRMPQHVAARNWLEEQLNNSKVGLPWESLLGFMRLVTNPRVFQKPETTKVAWDRVMEWLQNENVWIPAPGEQHIEILESLLTLPSIQGKHIHDAHLAAIAIEHNLTLCSCDNDFARFKKLRWINPLAE